MSEDDFGGDGGGISMVVNTAPANYNWNIFRYIADFLHLGGIIVLFLTLARNRNTRGLSLKTQILYFLVFVTRYLDLLERTQNTYLVTFKITYIVSSALTLVAFWWFHRNLKDSYEADKDTASMPAMIVPCIVLALILPKYKKFMEIAWAFSEYLEGFAMVPQYVFCYRESAATLSRESGVLIYISCLGLYRVFYAFNWMYKLWMDPTYSDPQSWIGGIVEILFFVDFLMYQVQHWSLLRAIVLSIDDNVNEVVTNVEKKVFRRQVELDDFSGQSTVRQRRPVGKPAPYEEVSLQDNMV